MKFSGKSVEWGDIRVIQSAPNRQFSVKNLIETIDTNHNFIGLGEGIHLLESSEAFGFGYVHFDNLHCHLQKCGFKC